MAVMASRFSIPFLRRRNRPVMGVTAEGPRFTRWAAIYFVFYVAVPVLAVCLALDAGLYLLFKQVFHSCYGVLCFFE
jgi:hypothetical protein